MSCHGVFSSLQSRFKFPILLPLAAPIEHCCCVSTTCAVSTHDASLEHGIRVSAQSSPCQSTRKPSPLGLATKLVCHACHPVSVMSGPKQRKTGWRQLTVAPPTEVSRGSPIAIPLAVRHASQHQNFTWTSPIATFIADINVLRIDLLPLVMERVVAFKCIFRSDGERLHDHGSCNHKQL